MPRASACAVLFCLLGLPTASAAATGGAESPFFEPLPTVLTPSRLPQSLRDAPAAVTVIDREEIEALGYRDIPRLLRAVPGMQVGQERGSSHWVTYHGLGNDFPSEMQVLIDGRSVYSAAAFGGVDWLGLPVSIDEIDRIEVVRGTDSSAYGANALLGVISIFTRDPVGLPKTSAKATAGSGVRDLHAALRLDGEAGVWSLNAGRDADPGFAGLHDGHRADKASLRGDFRPRDDHELSLRVAGSRVRRGLGYPDSLLDNNDERDATSRSLALDLDWRHQPAAGEEWQLRAYHNHDRVDEAWTGTAFRTDVSPNRFAFVPLDRNRESARSDVELQHRRPLADDLGVLWGIGVRHDDLDSPFLFYSQPHHDQTLLRAFVNLDWRFAPHWVAHASALEERYSGDRPRASPRLHLNWQLDGRQTLRAGAARAWRQRNLFELFGDVRAIDPADGATLVRPFVPNPELRPTRVDSVELSYLGRFPEQRAQLDVRVFEERLTDFVVRETVASTGLQLLPSARYTNLSTPLVLRGVEYELQWRPLPATSLALTQTLIDRDSADDAQTRRTAAHSASLRWRQQWPRGIDSAATVYHMGPIAGGDGFVPGFDYQTPGYLTLDLSIAWKTRIGDSPATLRLTGTNLGGRHQEIPDRSEQLLHPNSPANRVSESIYLTVRFELP